MTHERVLAAIAEAGRFMVKAKAVVKRAADDKFTYYGSKETGALRRASLDLTRALADLRRTEG